MKNAPLIDNEDSKKLSHVLAQKVKKGFVVEEVNDKLPFVVLSKKPAKVNHRLNFWISCATFGLWSIPWAYQCLESKKERKIIIAIDEDGMPFEEKCFG